MSAPTTPVVDNFNRADGPVGANWTAIIATPEPLFAIVSNKAVAAAGLFTRSGYWNPTTFGGTTDCWVIWDAGHGAGTPERDVWVRANTFNATTPPNAGYVLVIIPGFITIYKADGIGGVTLIANVVTVTTSFVGQWLNITGTTLTAYTTTDGVAWTQQLTVVDTTFAAAGYNGFEMTGSTVAQNADTFGGGNQSGPTAADIPFPPAGRGASW